MVPHFLSRDHASSSMIQRMAAVRPSALLGSDSQQSKTSWRDTWQVSPSCGVTLTLSFVCHMSEAVIISKNNSLIVKYTTVMGVWTRCHQALGLKP